MNGHNDSDRLLDGWFAEGPSQLPDRVLDSIISQLEDNEQRRLIWLPERGRMNRMMLALGGVAAILIVVAAGAFYFGGRTPGVGTPPTASPNLSSMPTAEPSATPEPSLAEPSAQADGSLPVGSSHVLWDQTQEGRAPDLGIKIAVTIDSAGWFGEEGGGTLVKSNDVDAPDAPDGAGMIVFARTNDLLVGLGDLYVYGDPCHWASTKPDAPVVTVDQAIDALSGQASRDASTPADITLDGYSGKRVTLHVPDDAVFSECDLGEFRTFVEGDDARRYAQDPGQFDLLWVLDVSGELVIIDITYFEGTPQSVRDEIAGIVESMTLEYQR